MLKPTWVLLAASLLMSAQSAAAEDVRINLSGIGGRTCAYWLSNNDRKLEGTVWIYGFWSGLNYVAAASQQPQSSITGSDLITAVETGCSRNPSALLATAAWLSYVERSAK